MGADRIDNSKSHTKDNCVCACWSCNARRNGGGGGGGQNKKSVVQYTTNGDFIAEYPSIAEAIKETKIYNISRACKKKLKTAGGYIWRYKQ